jgi:hypothetical protein
MKTDILGYWLGGAASVVAGCAVISGVDFSPSADVFSLGLTLLVSFLLTAFGGLLWMVASTRLKNE